MIVDGSTGPVKVITKENLRMFPSHDIDEHGLSIHRIRILSICYTDSRFI